MANYEKYIRDNHTGEIALIKSNDYAIFTQKIQNKISAWEKRGQKLFKQRSDEAGITRANELNQQACQDINDANCILQSVLNLKRSLDWEKMRNNDKYHEFSFTKPKPKQEDYLKAIPKKSFFESFFKSLTKRRILLEEKAQNKFENDVLTYYRDLENAKARYNKEKEEYYVKQVELNNKVDSLKEDFENGKTEAVEKELKRFFTKSKYPQFINLNYDFFYSSERRTVIVDVSLPDPENIPNQVEYKYIPSKGDFSIKTMKSKEFNEFYDNLIAQISIRTIHEVFQCIYPDILDFVVLNGYVQAVDKKTGNDINNCILSIQAEKDYFLGLNLELVSPMECIKGMKGVIASDFINLAPVKPILKLNQEDKRIIETDEIIDDFNYSNNLAEMDWQKFETLVRDLFSKEFAGEGVEVKVTQASRDAGVDAIVFDPDPIKGGKYVIQAKRYNNTVGVSAVRDLFGTVLNEGAVKGILVTTSSFGKDSIEFVKNKPLTLISGAELVYLFNKHGYNVQINTRKRTS